MVEEAFFFFLKGEGEFFLNDVRGVFLFSILFYCNGIDNWFTPERDEKIREV